MRNRALGVALATAAMLGAGMSGGAHFAPLQISASGGAPAGQTIAVAPGSLASCRREQFISKAKRQGGGLRHWPPRTVAQDKRDARKTRNRKRSKR